MAAAPNIDHYRSFLVRRIFDLVQLPGLVRIILGLLILATPLLLAYVYGVLPALIDQGMWRTLLVNPVMIIYIIGVIPVLGRTDQQVVAALRPMVDVSDEEYVNLSGIQ